MSTEIKTNSASLRVAWNKGRLVGQKRPLRPKEVWAIRVRLQIKHRKRDLAMFNLAIDSKLRGCDLVSVRVDDIASGGHVRDRATIVRHKTGRPVQFEITEQTRASLQDWLNVRPASRRLRLPEPHPRSAPCDGSPICSHRAWLDRRPLPASPPTTAFVLLRLEDGGWDHASSGENCGRLLAMTAA